MVKKRTDPPPDVTASSRLGAGVENQLSRLFGESLLGAWPGLEQELSSPPPRVHKRRWGFTPWAILLLVGASFGFVMLRTSRPRLDRTSLERRAHYAEELGTFLQDGELERASEFVALVRGEGAVLDPADPHLDHVIFAEAALYRYLDADPARLARIRPLLPGSSASGSPERQLAGLTVLSRRERVERAGWFGALRAPLAKDPEFFHLLATVEEARGNLPAAREAWQRSAELGPAWWAHRFEQAEFERRHGDEAAAAKIAGQMLRADPESAWSHLAGSEFRVVPVASAMPRARPPVAVYHGELERALDAGRGDDLAGAKRHLASALDAVHGEAPFVSDAVDWLVEAKLVALAEELGQSARVSPKKVAP